MPKSSLASNLYSPSQEKWEVTSACSTTARRESKGIDSALGSIGIVGTVGTIIELNRSEKYRTLSSIQRSGEDLPETVHQNASEVFALDRFGPYSISKCGPIFGAVWVP